MDASTKHLQPRRIGVRKIGRQLNDNQPVLMTLILLATVVFMGFMLFGCDVPPEQKPNLKESAMVASPPCLGTLTVNSTPYAGAHSITSGGAVVCDPALNAQQNGVTSDLSVTLQYNYNAGIGGYVSGLSISTLTPAAVTTYTIPLQATLVWTLVSGTTTCPLTAGSVTVSAFPGVGGDVVGTFTGTELAVGGCPATVSGSFSIPRSL